MGKNIPQTYYQGDVDFQRMCEEQDLDLVVNATPWEWHVPICIAAMENGAHSATEIPAALSIAECWQLVATAEQTQKHCIMLENVNYNRTELFVLQLVRQGNLGELVHLEGGYLHDLREGRLSHTRHFPPYWRLEHAIKRNANLYPTHGLGPLANYLDINRGDRFTHLVALSSPSLGLQEYIANHSGIALPFEKTNFHSGDFISCLIQTAKGKTIYLAYNVNSPRPYSRIHTVQGTQGIFEGYPDRLYLDGISPNHQWEDISPYIQASPPPLWERWQKEICTIQKPTRLRAWWNG